MNTVKIHLAACLMFAATLPVHPEEIWLYNNTRVYGLIESINKDREIGVLQPTGEVQTIPLENVIAIRFLGRSPKLIQAGTQEFRFVHGGKLRAQIRGNTGDNLNLQTSFAGSMDLDFSYFKGFIGLPMVGFTGRKAEELVEGEAGRMSLHKDVVLDRRGSTVNGVVRKVERTALHLDIDDILQVRPFKMHYLKGVRLADASRDTVTRWDGSVQVFIATRDGSLVRGDLTKVHLGTWYINPVWNPSSTVVIDFNEITIVQTIGGRVQYLSQMNPVEVREQTILAPPQPYQMNRSCQGDSLSIAGKRYPWGIGVHADSELVFELNGRFKEFRSDIGISTTMGNRGSAEFSVVGDGKNLFKSSTIRGDAGKPETVSVKIDGIKKLSLRVTSGDDLDLGDVANWGSARVLR